MPQGSILGPLIYIIFTNDLPESVHNHLVENGTFVSTDCTKCGTICCYADDSTYSISSKDPQDMIRIIAEKYTCISTYMNNNKLVLNSDKTHLMVMASSKKHKNTGLILNPILDF